MSGMELAPDGFIWCGKKRELSLYLTHIRTDGDDEPALYIRNERRRIEQPDPLTGVMKPGCPAYLVPLRDLWVFRPEDRDRGRHRDVGEMASRLANASIALFGMDVPDYRFRIHDAILEFAEDVKNLAPPPEVTREQWLAQMASEGITLKINGEAVN